MNNYDNKQEKTLVIVKPDGVQRSLIGEVIKRYEQCGLKLVALKMVIPSREQALKHYSVDPQWALKTGTKSIEAYKAKGLTPPTEDPIEFAEKIRKNLLDFISSGPIVAMVWQGMNAIGIVRKITGSTEPLASNPGTIRGDYTIDSYNAADTDSRAVRNIIHASSSVEEANSEINLWFDKKEILNYRLIAEEILYDANLDGILE
ncbi:MAG: nucleoside-diphosphate kinase [Candidatus Shapirobacteria bacterium]|jgi:nucleoside-diphosphate kinase|nr:nucleoside-diphosphate kinase [Candidatus Shapirobacteria bacterium]